MPSKAINATWADSETLIVTISHDVRDSFSRSVDPAAKRWARTVSRVPLILSGAEYGVRASSGYDSKSPAGNVESDIYFRR